MSVKKETFPLDESEIKRRKWTTIFTHPSTYIFPFFGYMFGSAFASGAVGALALAAPILGVGIGAFLSFRYWKDKDDRLDDKVIRDLIKETDSAQDRALLRARNNFRRAGFTNYAASVGRFLVLKQHIEKRLQQPQLTDKKAEVNNLVDNICFNSVDQLSHIIKIERAMRSVLVQRDAAALEETDKVRRRLLTQVVHAFSTLQDTAQNLDHILEPDLLDANFNESSDRLQQSIERLQDETKIADKIRETLRRNPDDEFLDYISAVEPDEKAFEETYHEMIRE